MTIEIECIHYKGTALQNSCLTCHPKRSMTNLELFHHLWSKAVGTTGYRKTQWLDLEARLAYVSEPRRAYCPSCSAGDHARCSLTICGCPHRDATQPSLETDLERARADRGRLQDILNAVRDALGVPENADIIGYARDMRMARDAPKPKRAKPKVHVTVQYREFALRWLQERTSMPSHPEHVVNAFAEILATRDTYVKAYQDQELIERLQEDRLSPLDKEALEKKIADVDSRLRKLELVARRY